MPATPHRVFPEALTVEQLNAFNAGIPKLIGIEFTEVGPDHLAARMPVDDRTRQPLGLLHGGASVVLAETLGSMASFALVGEGKTVVGLEINANHLRAVREGFVVGTATPLHIGGRTHVWDIKIRDAGGKLVCVSRLTVAVTDPR